MVYLVIFWVFIKVGALTFGGGYAMLPILRREVVDSKGWISADDLTDYFAVGQCLPGIIAVNTAVLIGKRVKGNWGGIIAALGVVLPSIVSITLIAAVLNSFIDNEYVIHAFAGIRICVCVLVLNTLISLFKKSVVDIPTCLIFIAVLCASLLTALSPVWYVLLSAAAGILISFLNTRKRGA